MEHVGGDFRHAAPAGSFHQLLVDVFQFLGPFLHALFQIVPRRLQGGVARLNLREHFVEPVHQLAHFIVALFVARME
jgi:hypothetical protein